MSLCTVNIGIPNASCMRSFMLQFFMEIAAVFSCSTSSQKANQMLGLNKKRSECKAI